MATAPPTVLLLRNREPEGAKGMNYFIPDLLARFGSTDDAVADAAQAEWEQAHARYLAHLTAIRSNLPRAVRGLVRRFNLHDARVLTLAFGRRSLSLVLALDAPRGQGLRIDYGLASNPVVIQHATPAEEETTPLEWLYDEIGLAERGGITLFTHSILFTRGRELQLAFYDLRLKRYRKVLSPAEGLKEGGDASGVEALLT